MMGQVVKFVLKAQATRKQALQWLRLNYAKFPIMQEGEISGDLFHGWRFVDGIDGTTYFANCLEPGIVESEIKNSGENHG